MAELKWFPASIDRTQALTRLPVACLRPTANAAITAQVELGELAFNSPALLGGQAEKKNLSCGSCHQNGRGNPNFQFEAVSGAPGTADVTSGLFSKVRADNTFNPLPIPDLATQDGRDQVNRDDREALAIFVRGQIEEEFSGDPPPAPVFEALLTYLQHIDGEGTACDLTASTPRTWQQDWDSARLAAGQISKAQTDQTKAFYTRTARLSLRRLHDRYGAAAHADIRARLIKISRDLATGTPWPDTTEDLGHALAAAEPSSYYNGDTLARALELAER